MVITCYVSLLKIKLQGKAFLDSDVWFKMGEQEGRTWCAEGRINEKVYFIVWSLIVCVCVLVTQSCPTLCNPMDCSPPGFSVHGISPGKNSGIDCHSLLQKFDYQRCKEKKWKSHIECIIVCQKQGSEVETNLAYIIKKHKGRWRVVRDEVGDTDPIV